MSGKRKIQTTKKSKKKTGKQPAADKHVKVAITIPSGDFKTIEELREKMDLSRSSFLLLAVRKWILEKSENSTRKNKAKEAPGEDPLLWPQDEWERGLMESALDCGVSLPDSALSSEGLYD